MPKTSKRGGLGNLSARWPIFVGGLLIVLILAGISSYRNYLASPGQIPVSSSQVSIGQPASGSEVEVLSPVGVSAMAIGPNPFISMELWIDGNLMGVQAGPGDGKTPLTASFNWLPKEVGAYSLVARALDTNGNAVTSPAIQVFVVEAEIETEDDVTSAGTFASVPAVSPGLGGGEYTPPSVPPPGDPTNEAQPWNPSFGNWFLQIFQTDEELPNAPDVAADIPFGCDAKLYINDLSDNEDGFLVYKQIGNSPNWEIIDTLQVWNDIEWFTYEDPGVYGIVTYYVSAFNEAGEAASNPTTAFAPGECQPPAPEISSALAVQFQGLNMLNTAPPDMLYCYRSINGGIWSRWPSSDFFYPNQDGSFTLNEVMEIVTMQIDAWMEQSYSVDLECWGWYGAELKNLGALHYGGQGPGAGNFSIIGDALQANLAIQPIDDLGPFFQLGGDIGSQFALDLGGDFFKFMINQQMQFPMVQVTYNPDLCESHLPPEFQNLFGRILFCFPYPGFHGSYAEGDNPQPYLIWDFWNQCRDGYGIEPDGACRSYQYYMEQANLNSGKLGFLVYDWSSAGFHQWVVEAPQLFEMTIPPNGCTGQRTFSVVMFYEEDGFTQFSPKGNDWSIDCPKAVGNVVTLDFVFENLTLNNLDDGDSGEQTVELYGYFQVMAPSSQAGNNNFLKMGAWDEQWSDCPDDTGSFTSSNAPGSCTQRFTNGSYNLANVPLCKSSDYTQNSEYHCWMSFGNTSVQDLYQTNNNFLRVQVTDGDGINLALVLHDWDDASANDLVCFGFSDSFASAKTIFEWHALDGQSFAIPGLGNDGSCSVTGVIHVVE